MGRKFFTIDEVNQLIPQLEYHFRHLLTHKKEMAKASMRLKKMGISPKLLEEPTQGPNVEINDLQHQVRNHYLSFKQHLLAIENMGGEVKDLELGRVDFLSQQLGNEVKLTWQLGVTEVVYQHPHVISAGPLLR